MDSSSRGGHCRAGSSGWWRLVEAQSMIADTLYLGSGIGLLLIIVVVVLLVRG